MRYRPRRRRVAALLGGLTLLAAASPLLTAAIPASADRVVVGGVPASIEKHPWVVALASLMLALVTTTRGLTRLLGKWWMT